MDYFTGLQAQSFCTATINPAIFSGQARGRRTDPFSTDLRSPLPAFVLPVTRRGAGSLLQILKLEARHLCVIEWKPII